MSAASILRTEEHAPTVELSTFTIRFERAATPGDVGIAGVPARFYAMRIERGRQVPLEGVGAPPGWDLVVSRGRADGKHATSRREPFASLSRAIERWGHFCEKRRTRGYREVRA